MPPSPTSLTGRNPHSRLFSTASFSPSRGAGGFQPGLKSAFGIGVFRGNPGHMAGTLGGLNVESRGSAGVVVGPNARGARDPIFNMQFHLPQAGGRFIGGGGGAFVGDLVKKALGVVTKPIKAGLARIGGDSMFGQVLAAMGGKLLDGGGKFLGDQFGFAGGLDKVPYDAFTRVHRNEMILSPHSADVVRSLPSRLGKDQLIHTALTIEPQPVEINLDGRTIARVVTERQFRDSYFRGAKSGRLGPR